MKMQQWFITKKTGLSRIFLTIITIVFALQLSIIATANDYTITDIALSPGRNPSELNFAWYTPENPDACVVQIALKEDVTDADFPVDKANVFTGTISPATEGLSSSKVTVSDLKNSTEYVYRLGDGKGVNWSPVYNYTTRDPQDFGFIFVGDPQIGTSSSTLAAESQAWKDTLAKAVGKFPEASFLLPVGDQVQTNKINLYNHFFSPEQLRSLPIAPVAGNHDVGAKSFPPHFNLPNVSQYGRYDNGKGGEDGDYYYSYGDTLFMFLNSNNQYSAEHNAFMKEAVAANPDAKWKVLMFHHSIYTTGDRHDSTYVGRFINGMVPVIDELGIDLVLMGHDHVYVRTYQMKGNQPLKEQTVDENGNVLNPTGTLYITGNSSTGSKYYPIVLEDAPYAAVSSQIQVPTFSYVNINSGRLSINTYRTDTMEVMDSYTILKKIPIEQAPGLSLDSFSFMKDSNKISSIDPDEADSGEIYGTAVLSNEAEVPYDLQLLMAKYDEDDRLVKLYIADKTEISADTDLEEGIVSKTISTPSIDVSTIQEGEYLKLFLFKDLDNILPYVPSIKLTEKKDSPEPSEPPGPTPSPSPTPPPGSNLYTFECEDLETIASGAEESDFTDSECSEGAGNMLAADDVDDYVQYDVNFPTAGTWEISVVVKTGNSGGKFKLYLPQSEKYVGTEQDQYSSNDEIKTIYLGKYSFKSAGNKQFRFVVTGKNELSEGYTLSFDSITITKQ